MFFLVNTCLQEVHSGDEERSRRSDSASEETEGRGDRCCHQRDVSDQVSHLTSEAYERFTHRSETDGGERVVFCVGRSLTVVIEQMEQFSRRLGDLSSRVESTHENTAQGLELGARQRDEQLRGITTQHWKHRIFAVRSARCDVMCCDLSPAGSLESAAERDERREVTAQRGHR